MRYDLYRGAAFVASSVFPEGQQPTLSPNKGRLLKYDPPAYSPDTQQLLQGEVTEKTVDAIPFTVQTKPLPDRRLAMKSALAGIRFSHETGGITITGVRVRTDRESQALITGAYTAAVNGVIESFDFKGTSGFVTLTAEQILGIGAAVALHVQACFTREKKLAAAIDAAADHAALSALDLAADWPGTAS